MKLHRDPLLELPEDERKRFLATSEELGTFLPELTLRGWAQTVAECRTTYQYALEEYRNDLDGRKNIQRVVDALSPHSLPTLETLLAELDEEFRQVTVAVERPIWGEEIAEADPEKHFFYFRLPRWPGPEIRDGLFRLGYDRELNDALRQA
jgi:hypothetical protein